MKAYVSRTETLLPSCSYEVPAASIISPVIVRELAELWCSVAAGSHHLGSKSAAKCVQIISFVLFHLKVAINVVLLTPAKPFRTLSDTTAGLNWQNLNVDRALFESFTFY